jgi:cell division protein FtsA
MAKRDDIVVGLDLGTTKVCTVVAEQAENGEISVLGLGTAGSLGLKQGMVVSIDDTVEAIGRAVEEAEGMSGVEIRAVVAGVSGGHLKGINNRATVGVKGGEVRPEDILGVLDAARAVELSRDDEIIHVTPQRYVLDAQDAISDPIGMAGHLLSVEAHVITGAGTAVQNLTRCVQRAGLEVSGMVPQPLASALAVLSPEELELGVALVDIGGGTTDLAVFVGGSVRHTWVLGLGGNHVTRDISFGLATPIKEAERIKVQFGFACPDRVEDEDRIEVPSVGGRPPRTVARRLLAEIIEARMEEILGLVAEEIERSGLKRRIGSGLVLTGGGALLSGVGELAARATGLSARRGNPVGLGGLTELAASPKHATAVGLARFALAQLASPVGALPAPRGISRLRGWVKEFF